ncbi:MAG: SPFH domain-containing protein, partial [Candidatus Latescibacterota bacterium]
MPRGDFGDQFDFKKVSIPSVPKGLIRWGIPGLLILLFLASSIYTVGPEELGVILRLGKFERSTDPGLHFKLPFGIERVTKVPVQRQLKEEFGFQTVTAGVRSQFSTQGRSGESNMLTGDLNAAVV